MPHEEIEDSYHDESNGQGGGLPSAASAGPDALAILRRVHHANLGHRGYATGLPSAKQCDMLADDVLEAIRIIERASI